MIIIFNNAKESVLVSGGAPQEVAENPLIYAAGTHGNIGHCKMSNYLHYVLQLHKKDEFI